jgi:hypothetical protein
MMDVNSDGALDALTNTYGLVHDWILFRRQDYMASYGVELRQDDFRDPSSIGANDGDAFKYTIRTSHTLFLDSSRKRALSGTLAYVGNNAKGSEREYFRIEAGANYTAPMKRFKNASWSLGLSAYQLEFSKATNDRSDTNMSLNYVANKVLSDRWSLTGIANYTNNASNVGSSQYSKYSVTGLVSYLWAE